MDNKNKKLMIVFEGPDMCGKTTQLDMAYNRLKQEYVNVAKWKFPDYTGKCGQDILYHLKHFNIKNRNAKRALEELRWNSINMVENKFGAISDSNEDPVPSILYDEPYEHADVILCDRFTASQFVYDIAWIPLLYKKHLFPFMYKKVYRGFAEDILKRVNDTIDYYSKYFDIEFIYFDKSPFIKDHIERTSPDRRIDEYDSNTAYQRLVSDLFSTLALQITVPGELDCTVSREALRTYHPQIREAVYFGDSLICDIMKDISTNVDIMYRYVDVMKHFAPKNLSRVIDPDMGYVVQNIGSIANNMPDNAKSYEARVINAKTYTHMSTMTAIADIFSRHKDNITNCSEICESLVNKHTYGMPDAMKGV